MSPVGYNTMMEGKSKQGRFQLKLEQVKHAQRQGPREAALAFLTIPRATG